MADARRPRPIELFPRRIQEPGEPWKLQSSRRFIVTVHANGKNSGGLTAETKVQPGEKTTGVNRNLTTETRSPAALPVYVP
jgi:hypothetical protein